MIGERSVIPPKVERAWGRVAQGGGGAGIWEALEQDEEQEGEEVEGGWSYVHKNWGKNEGESSNRLQV